MSTIKDIHNELLENIFDYLNSNEDKISTIISSKATKNDPYLQEYINKRKQEHLLHEAMHERIILEYNDRYPHDHTSIYESSPPSFQTFKDNWIKNNKDNFMKPLPKPKPISNYKPKSKSKSKTIKRILKRFTRKKTK